MKNVNNHQKKHCSSLLRHIMIIENNEESEKDVGINNLSISGLSLPSFKEFKLMI